MKKRVVKERVREVENFSSHLKNLKRIERSNERENGLDCFCLVKRGILPGKDYKDFCETRQL